MIDFDKYDVIVVGSGIAGAMYARHYADNKKRVLVMEKRSHIAGNLYDYEDDGIIVQKYGPHCFHTNSDDVIKYINKYSNWYNYKVKCDVFMHNMYTPSPFNFRTIDQFYSKKEAEFLKNELLCEYPNRSYVTILELLKSKNECIKGYANFLYESDYSLYTAKQWKIRPEDVDPNVLCRVPILLNYDEQYFYDRYQVMPERGFTSFISNILNDSNIETILEQDVMNYISFTKDEVLFNGKEYKGIVVYTGEIDRLFNYKYGKLPYRSLKFEFCKEYTKSFQNAPIVVYPEDKDITRITEFSKLMKYSDRNHTIYAKEYPENYVVGINEPYYPINNEESNEIYNQYYKLKINYKNLVLAGRLANFKYYNMDQIILSILNELKNLEV